MFKAKMKILINGVEIKSGFLATFIEHHVVGNIRAKKEFLLGIVDTTLLSVTKLVAKDLKPNNGFSMLGDLVVSDSHTIAWMREQRTKLGSGPYSKIAPWYESLGHGDAFHMQSGGNSIFNTVKIHKMAMAHYTITIGETEEQVMILKSLQGGSERMAPRGWIKDKLYAKWQPEVRRQVYVAVMHELKV